MAENKTYNDSPTFIPARLESSVHGLNPVADAKDIYDINHDKWQKDINDDVETQGEHLSEVDESLNNRYTKEETYSKTEVDQKESAIKGGSNKSIATLDGEVSAEIERATGVEAGLRESIDELGQIGLDPENAISTNGDDFDGDTLEKRSKIPTIGSVLDGADEEPTPGSEKLVKSGGIAEAITCLNDISSDTTDGYYIDLSVSEGSAVDLTPIENGSFQYLILDVVENQQFNVKGSCGTSPRLWAFIDNSNILISKCDSNFRTDEYVTITAPQNGKLICSSFTTSAQPDYPFSLLQKIPVTNKVQELDEKINETNEDLHDNEYKGAVLSSINSYRVGLVPLVNFYGYDEGGRWVFVGNSSYKYRLFVIKSGDVINIKAGTLGSHYAFISDIVEPVNNANVNYVQGTSRVVLSPNVDETFTSPADCYLYVLETYNNNSYVPLSLTVNGVEQLGILGKEELPKGILVYSASSKKFTFYGRRGNSKQYFSFVVKYDKNDDEIVYMDLWHLTKGHLCNYNDGSFTPVCETINDAEDEFAIKFKGKADFTGGYHGDERIDVDNSSFVHFFADGKLIQDGALSNDFSVECEEFSYEQYSTLHETTEDGSTVIEGHPIVAFHFKKAIFKGGHFCVENSIKMASPQIVTTAFAGLFCTGKGTATKGIIPYGKNVSFSSNDSQISADNKKDAEVIMWNPDTEVKCYMDGHFLQGYNDTDDVNYYLIWDRTVDSKYYRGCSVETSFDTGSIIRNKFSCRFL